jgi:glycosyltransferase involved in cell wall biosynthesis
MVAPVTHPYHADGYNPWERVTHDLTERLVEGELDVTLFAPTGSVTAARLVETVNAPLTETPEADPRLVEAMHLAVAMEAAADGAFDVVHSHLHVHALVFSRLIPCPLVTTLHGAAWDEAHHPLLRRYRHQPFVSLSEAERRFLPELRYVATVPNGIHVDDFPLGGGAGGYLAFVGRMAPEKAPDLAVEVASRCGLPLRMAGIVEGRHEEFFRGLIGAADGAEYLGHLARAELAEMLGDATALLMPLRWDEPFGLVVAESLAVGTPVIAWRRGAMEEIVDDGVTGFLVDDVPGAVAAVDRVATLSRAGCRAAAQVRFSDIRMAAGYVDVYRRLAVTSSRR